MVPKWGQKLYQKKCTTKGGYLRRKKKYYDAGAPSREPTRGQKRSNKCSAPRGKGTLKEGILLCFHDLEAPLSALAPKGVGGAKPVAICFPLKKIMKKRACFDALPDQHCIAERSRSRFALPAAPLPWLVCAWSGWLLCWLVGLNS